MQCHGDGPSRGGDVAEADVLRRVGVRRGHPVLHDAAEGAPAGGRAAAGHQGAGLGRLPAGGGRKLVTI